MNPSICKDATGKVPTKMAASTTSEPKRSLKRSKAQVDPAQTLQEPEQETTSPRKKRVLEALRLFADCPPLDKCDIDQLPNQIRAVFKQHDGICTPEGIKSIRGLTSYELQMVRMFCSIFLAKTHFEVYHNEVEAIISDQEKTIADLKAKLAINSKKFSSAKTQLSISELSRVRLNSRVKSLEAELESKNAEIEALKNQATASEQKASSTKEKALSLVRKIIRLGKFSKELSMAANNAIEDLKGFEEFQDHAAELMLFLSSSREEELP